MEIHDQRVPYLIARYRNGKISTQEQAELDCWIAESIENRDIFEHVAGLSAAEKYKDYSLIDRTMAWKELRRAIDRRSDTAKKRRLLWAVSAAAVVLAVLFAGVGDRLWAPDPRLSLNEVGPGGNKAILTLDDGTEIPMEDLHEKVVRSADALITITGGEVVYSEVEPTALEAYNTVTVPRGGEYKITLSDGTQVWLNSDSRIRYPLSFSGEERRVHLSGEAYFDVTTDPARPFVVNTDRQDIKVLGTRFNIAAHKDDAYIFTTLVSGSVSVTNRNSGEMVTLTAGEQSRLDNMTNTMTVARVNTDEFISWRNGFINIDGNTLEEVLIKLSRWYDVDFSIAEERVRDIVFEGDIPKNSSLSSVINTLETAGRIRFKVKGDEIEVGAK